MKSDFDAVKSDFSGIAAATNFRRECQEVHSATPASTVVRPSFAATDADVQRFMQLVDRLPNGCWFWTGARSRGSGNRKWYGSFRVGGRVVRAHRFASEAISGHACPPGHHRDHTCCFSLCVNPEHLQVVSREENQRRKVSRLALN